MNNYETLYVIKPNLEEEACAALIEKFAGIISGQGGEIEKTDEWGKRRLAYPIRFKNEGCYSEGYYVLVEFKAPPTLPLELERNFKINESIMRFMVVKKA